MHLALGAITSLLGSGAAAAGGAAAAAGIGSAGASILSGVATAGSVLSTLAGGASDAAGYTAKAGEATLDAGAEQIEGVRRQSVLKQQLARALGENDVAFAAAGIDIGSGIAADTRRAAETKTTQELTIDRDTTEARRKQLLGRAAGYTRMASSSRGSAMLSAIGIGAGGLLRASQVGTPSAGEVF